MSSQHPETFFQTLMQSFLHLLGQDSPLVASVDHLKFLAGQFLVVIKHPPSITLGIQNETIIIEIHLHNLPFSNPEESANGLLMLHRINNVARFHHSWLAFVSDDNTLLITNVMPLRTTDVLMLQTEISDGVSRAKALESLWTDTLEKNKVRHKKHDEQQNES